MLKVILNKKRGLTRVLTICFVCITFLLLSTKAYCINLPKTGQATCYNESGNIISCASTGQDGDIQAGVAWPSPRFTDNGDNTVTDNLTGLVWTQDANLPNDDDITWQEALDYVAGMNAGTYSNLGHTDWRLPNLNELESLVNAEEVNPGTWLNGQGFTNVSGNYWSSTGYAANTSHAWYVNMRNGYVPYYNKTSDYSVWPVRAGSGGSLGNSDIWKTGQAACYDGDENVINCTGTGQDGDIQAGVAWPDPRFTDNGDSTVTDNLTGLVWTQDANLPNDDITWQEALDYVAGLNSSAYLGYTDWRLPNRKELFSLIDRSQYSPALPPGHPFTNVQSSYYWSSTSYAAITSHAWTVSMSDGYVSYRYYNDKTSNYYVWPVRVSSGWSSTFQWPAYPYTFTPTAITQNYADNSSGDYHTGIDIGTTVDANDTVKAVAGGKVSRLDEGAIDDNNHEMGNVVIIDHSFSTNPVGSFFSLYAHLASIDVDDGEIIEKGDPIGTIGDTGCRDLVPQCGKHLHLEFKTWNVLGNISDSGSQPPVYWGYTPDKPNWHGYINPYPYLEYDIINISPTAILVTTTTEELLRTGPGIDYEETFGSVSDKQKFVAFSEYNGWYQVYIPSNYGPATGWIQGTVESSATISEVNVPNKLSVRDKPSTTDTTILSYVWDDQWVVHTGQTQTASGDECGEQWYEIYLPDGLSSLTGWVCGEYLLVNDKAPAPDIKVNNSDEAITIDTKDSLSVSINLDAGDYSGERCDWWLVANTPSGWEYYDLALRDFTSGLSVTYQSNLFDLDFTEILNTLNSDIGTYTYYFGVDLNIKGTLDNDQLFYDSVAVTVEARQISAPTELIAKLSGSTTVQTSWVAVSGVDGYKLYYGSSSGNYTGLLDVGNVTYKNFYNMPDGTYYIAVTAYADAGSAESSYSNEVSITVKTSPSTGDWSGSWSCDGAATPMPCNVSGGNLSLSLSGLLQATFGTITFSGSPCGLPTFGIDNYLGLSSDGTGTLTGIKSGYMVLFNIRNNSSTSMSGTYQIADTAAACINNGTFSLNRD